MTAGIDLERIFIGRNDQIIIVDAAVQAWKRQMATHLEPGYMAIEQDHCIVWLFGDGGLGKSTLLKHYREELSASEPELHVGRIIDWSFLLNDDSRLWYFITHDIDEIAYLEKMYQQLSWSMDRRLSDFKEYKRNKNILKDIEERIGRVSRNIQKVTGCNLLWKIPKVRMLKLFRYFAHVGVYEQDVGEAARKLREYIGKDVNIDLACIRRLYEELHQKLGEEFNDYLQTGYILSAALGHDLQRFACEEPLLVLFDTYECIEKGDSLLRNIIDAAGTRVGWFIAGRSHPWTSLDEPGFFDKSEYKRNTLSPHSVVSISLQARGSGSFSSEEIIQYFAQLCKQKPLLATIKKQDVEKIQYLTQGIPLAVNIAAQFYAQTGRLDMLFEKSNGVREVIEGMVERYLLYVPYDRKERIILYGLAMLRRTNNLWIISQFAGVNPGQRKPLAEQLRLLLHSAHAVFIVRDQVSLHYEIRHFLRQWLLQHWGEPEKLEVARQLQILLQSCLDDLEKRCPYQRLGQRFEDDAWINAYLDLIEAHFWVETNQAFYYCLPFMLASIIYRRDLLDDIVAIGDFFRGGMTLLHGKQWDWMAQGLRNNLFCDVADAERLLDKLEQLLADMAQQIPFPFTQWKKELEGALYWKRAELHQKHNRDKAMYWYQKAICHIENCDLLREEAASVCWLIAMDFCEKEDYEKSLNELKEVLKIKFDFADANYSRGNIYYKIGEYNRAVTEYQYAIALDDHYTSAYIDLGNIYLVLQRYQESIDLYSTALVLEPSSAVLYNNRALAYTSLGVYEEALADYHRTIALQTDFAEAYTNRGTIYAYLHRYEEALSDYNQAYELFPHNIHIAWMAMWANLEDQQTLEHEKVEALIQLAPEHYLAYICRSISLALERRKHKLSVILEAVEQAICMEPDQWDHYFWKGMICCYYQNTILAQDAFEKAINAGLPPLLLKPLYWLKTVVPLFFEAYAASLLAKAGL